ncbi:MAG: Holliday junction resolvase RuvX [Chloroflexota bacterium]
MRYLALDVGERRIGIAVTESGLLATPHSVLQRRSKIEDFAYLERLVAELQIERIIVGLPYSLAGHETIGPQARRIQRYAKALGKAVDVPIDYYDESYSTVEAKNYLGQQGLRNPKKAKTGIDAAAATVILQKYLDTKNKL